MSQRISRQSAFSAGHPQKAEKTSGRLACEAKADSNGDKSIPRIEAKPILGIGIKPILRIGIKPILRIGIKPILRIGIGKRGARLII
jgi:hypothetical protein